MAGVGDDGVGLAFPGLVDDGDDGVEGIGHAVVLDDVVFGYGVAGEVAFAGALGAVDLFDNFVLGGGGRGDSSSGWGVDRLVLIFIFGVLLGDSGRY